VDDLDGEDDDKEAKKEEESCVHEENL